MSCLTCKSLICNCANGSRRTVEQQAQHTAGRLIAATAVSSVVGLPIVSQSGRSVANATTVPEGFPNAAAINAESLANARRLAECWNACAGIPIDRLVELASLADEPRNTDASYWKARYLLLAAKQPTAQPDKAEVVELVGAVIKPFIADGYGPDLHLRAAQAALAAIPQRDDSGLVAALKEVVGCFAAADTEGLQERLAEADIYDVGSLADLVFRRLLHALPPAQQALSKAAQAKAGAV